jgi:IS5 family transposase
LATILRTHFLQQWFTKSVLSMEKALFDVFLCREFAQFPEFMRKPDVSTILRFRHRLEIERGLLLKTGTMVDATLVAEPSANKNNEKACDPEMNSSQKGNQWQFGMKAHMGADADSGLASGLSCFMAQ